ncbi:MAG: sulfatase, partial [Rubrimonas sp.]
PPRRGMRAPLAALAALSTALAAADVGHALGRWRLPVAAPYATAFTARVGVEHLARNVYTLGELAEFRRAAEDDPMAGAPGLFAALQGRDLIIAYVESYGRSSFENPLYAGTHPATLAGIEARLTEAGLATRSGWLTAPMVGGQSWLAHASVASGLWISDQGRYRAMLASPRRTLHHFAQEAGLRTVAIKPAHVFDWPEGDYFGYDAIYNAADLGYGGRPFNWATMPDQFTLKAFDRLERLRPDRPPLVAQIALVSSHAPFLPVPPVLDWDDIGDGSVFNAWADDGDPPEVVWRDPDRVREKFRLAIDYSLRAVGSYAERLADGSALLVVLGDHEPAPFISGVSGFDVPVHVIGPADLVDRFAALDWRPGLIPDPATPALRMDAMRDALLRALSGASS